MQFFLLLEYMNRRHCNWPQLSNKTFLQFFHKFYLLPKSNQQSYSTSVFHPYLKQQPHFRLSAFVRLARHPVLLYLLCGPSMVKATNSAKWTFNAKLSPMQYIKNRPRRFYSAGPLIDFLITGKFLRAETLVILRPVTAQIFALNKPL